MAAKTIKTFSTEDLSAIFFLMPNAKNHDCFIQQEITRDVSAGDPVANLFRSPDVRRLAHAPPHVRKLLQAFDPIAERFG